MAKTRIAKLFRNGRSQAVRLPQEFRFEGDRARIRRIDQGVLLKPAIPNAASWFDELDPISRPIGSPCYAPAGRSLHIL